jgi:serine/threonine protein phosphatase 1
VEKLHTAVIIVHDGKSPKAAAKNLCDYLKELGQPAGLWDSNEYRNNMSSFPNTKLIIVGHHSLARKELQNVGELKYDKFGMKFGFKDNLCVLRASKSEVKLEDQAVFGEFYNERIRYYTELTRKFDAASKAEFLKMEADEMIKELKEIFSDGDKSLSDVVAKAIGAAVCTPLFALGGVIYALQKGIETTLAVKERKNLREIQYSLLMLEFIALGLSEFLELPDSQNLKKNIGPEDIDDIVDDLVKQMDAAKDETININEIMKRKYKLNEIMGMETLRKHLGNDIVFTGVWGDATEERQLEDSELLPGELSAVIFTIGCYTVRSAQRVYKEHEDYGSFLPENAVPADEKDLAFVKESKYYSSQSWTLNDVSLPSPWDGELRITQEITAKHNSDPEGVFAGNFKYVCRAVHKAMTNGDEVIELISAIKKDASSSDENASLFVLLRINYLTALFAKVYRLAQNGVITEYREQEYDWASSEASWKDTERTENKTVCKMTYCISDIHGCYDEFMELLRKIDFSSDDTMYVLGDAIDRGPQSIRCLRYIMGASNIHMLMGNHEQMMLKALTHVKDDSLMRHWLDNGGTKTLPEFRKLSEDEQIAIKDYISNLPYHTQVKIGEQNYVLVHAGLNVADASVTGEISTAKVLPKQNSHDQVWIRDKFYHEKALPKSITVFGHTPIPNIERSNDGKIWRDKRFKDKIGIDGGCVFGGNLLALRLDDMAEFAVNASSNRR